MGQHVQNGYKIINIRVIPQSTGKIQMQNVITHQYNF